MLPRTKIPAIVCIVGGSESGKTTLMEKLIPELKRRGVRVGTIKHHMDGFEMDRPGKDSWRHKQAGSVTTIISSPHRIGMVTDVDHDYDPDELASFFLSSGADVILAEGYKGGNKPKVEIFRPEVHEKPLCLEDENLIALITDVEMELRVPRFATDDARGLAHFLIKRFELDK